MVFDLDAYLARLGLSGSATLAQIHRAHVCSIPFENLDPHRGVPVALDPDALQRKLVESGRGGYCFEQNLLLKAALEALGLEVEPLLARVRWGAPAGVVRPRTHLVLRVALDGDLWQADVGFGAGTLLEPIPFGPSGPHDQSGWRFRVVAEEDTGALVLQTESDGEWRDVYAIDPTPVPPIDIEVSNWFTATHPASAFVTGLIVTAQRPDGARVSLSDWTEQALVVRTPRESVVTPVQRAEIPALLDQHFGLAGFELTGAGRLALAATD
jgi:N-hydroxyarylamine O-acetyltransferase